MIQKLPKGWKIKELNRVIVDIIDYRGKTPRKLGGNWSESGTIALSAMNVKQGQLVNLEKARFVNGELYNKWMKSEVTKGDILMTSEAPLGETYLIPDDRKICLSQRLFCIRANPKVVLPRFLFYFFNSPISRKHIDLRATGTTVLGIRQSDLREIPIVVPPLATQRKIAAVLSAYDDLIENNTRRIKILEDMAQTLYREWFVHFRFPGHENVRMVESPLGLIPQGWQVKSFGEVSLNFDRQRKPLSGRVRAKMQGEYPYYGAAKVLDHINDYLFNGRYLLIGEDGSVVTEDGKPVLQLVTGKFWVNNHTHVVQGKSPISTNFLYLFISNVAVLGYVTGSAQPKINQQNLNRIPVISPPQKLLEKFDQMIESNFENITALKLKNASLLQTRDLLLPKLISGEIDISELDIDTDPKVIQL